MHFEHAAVKFNHNCDTGLKKARPSSDGLNDSAVGPHSRSIYRVGERTADKRDYGRDFLRRRKAPQNGTRTGGLENCLSNSLRSMPFSAASRFTNTPTPSDSVGPGSTAFTVTAVPVVVSASPRDMASCAVFVIP